MRKKLEAIIAKHAHLAEQMADPEIYGDQFGSEAALFAAHRHPRGSHPKRARTLQHSWEGYEERDLRGVPCVRRRPPYVRDGPRKSLCLLQT